MSEPRNQLLVWAEPDVPDLSEFDSLSVKDIALSITLWPEDSEDQRRAIEALRARAPGIGHNRPPLAERLDADFAELLRKKDQLIAIANTAAIVDEESAGKVMTIAKTMADLEGEIDDYRMKLQAPYRAAMNLVAERAKAIIEPLKLARIGEDGKGGLRQAITAYDDKVRAEADEQKRIAREEQQRREQEAERARIAAEEAAAKGRGSMVLDLAAQAAADQAERAGRRAEAIRPEPLRSHVGTVSRRRTIEFDIGDLPETLKWMQEDEGRKAALAAFVRSVVQRHLTSLGIETVATSVAKGAAIVPGASVKIGRGAANIRS